MQNKLRAAELQREDILQELLVDSDMARAAGQLSAAIRGHELIGRELHGMFTERRENLTINIDAMSEQQMQAKLVEAVGEDLANQLIKQWYGEDMKLIEHVDNDDA
jgi:hypothetical protein